MKYSFNLASCFSCTYLSTKHKCIFKNEKKTLRLHLTSEKDFKKLKRL